jgi:VIT1/CCC1 family predicted Fe2+/Mn2+ transporter
MSQEPMTKIQQRRWPRWARRGLMENVAIALILIGVFMLVQPFSITLYGWSFVTVLAGVVMFTVVSKFPE